MSNNTRGSMARTSHGRPDHHLTYVQQLTNHKADKNIRTRTCAIHTVMYMYVCPHPCPTSSVHLTYGTSHKKVSTVTPYVTLLDHYLFSTYNSITYMYVLRLMLSVHTHAYYEVRIQYGIQYAQHVACRLCYTTDPTM